MSSYKRPNAKNIGWKLENSKVIFESLWHNLRQDIVNIQDQDKITYTYMDHPGSVFVVPIAPSGEIILLHTYRYLVDEWCWEVPAGGLGDTTEITGKNITQDMKVSLMHW